MLLWATSLPQAGALCHKQSSGSLQLSLAPAVPLWIAVACSLPTARPTSAWALVLPVQHPLLWLLMGWCKWVAVTIPVPASPSEATWSCSKSLPKHLEQPVSPCRTLLSRSFTLPPPPPLSPADTLHLQLVPRPGSQLELLTHSPAAVAERPVAHRALPDQPEAGTLPPPLLHGHAVA